MKYNDITIILLLYKTPHKIIKNLKVYSKFKILILDQSNDQTIKPKIKKILPLKLRIILRKINGCIMKSLTFLYLILSKK